MKLTTEQQQQVVELIPLAERYGARYDKRAKDGEYDSLAKEALCEAVLAYDPTRGLTLRSWATMCIRNKLNGASRRETWERANGLAGGPPSHAAVDKSSGSGRMASPHHTDMHLRSTRNMDTSFPCETTNYLPRFIDMLPDRLQQIAIARWLCDDDLATIAQDEEMTARQVSLRLREAEGFMRLWIIGGNAA